MAFRFKGDYPPKRAAETLRQQVLDYLVKQKPGVGEPFLSEAQLQRTAGMSRTAVRRALADLTREGWLERQHGKGTFVGPRVRFADAAGPTARSRRGRNGTFHTLVRTAVVVKKLGEWADDWCSHEAIAGLNEVADEQDLSLELLGDDTANVVNVSRRLERSRPDVLVSLATVGRHAVVAGEAMRLGIKVILTGTKLMDLELPVIAKDGQAAAATAVRHLVEHGHRRIGLVVPTQASPWVFERRRGYKQALVDAGLWFSESAVLWMDGTDRDESDYFAGPDAPTAVVVATGSMVPRVVGMAGSTGRSVPRDLSLVTFDHRPDHYAQAMKIPATTLVEPMREIGRRVGVAARQLAMGQQIPRLQWVPYEFVPGATVASV